MGEEDQMAAGDCPPLHWNPGATISWPSKTAGPRGWNTGSTLVDSNMFPVLAFSSKPSLVSQTGRPCPVTLSNLCYPSKKWLLQELRALSLWGCCCVSADRFSTMKLKRLLKTHRGFPCDRLLESVTGWRWMSKRLPSTVGRTHCAYKQALVFVYVHVARLVVKNQKQVSTVCFLISIGILKLIYLVFSKAGILHQ